MSIRINNIAIKLDQDKNILRKKIAKKLKLKEEEIKSFKILKESVDARKKHDIKFVYCIEVECDNEEKLVEKLKDNDVKMEKQSYDIEVTSGEEELENRPVVVGFGPAGIFAALTLAEKGYKPIVIERGEDVDKRTETVDNFWKTGKLNLESNVQFGEGGAGAFSDGKLTTRIKDRRCDYVLRKFVEAGAPEEITYLAKPHVGTDLLKGVVKNIREKIKSLGGDVLFSHKLEKVNHENGQLKSIIVNGKEIPCNNLILAVGHSARDTYEMLYENKLEIQPKAFAIGVRIEHPQEIINISQYGDMHTHEKLKAAEYKLVYQSKNLNRAVYSFCMCPGGVVVAAASEEGRLVSNGMSYHARDLDNANSALVVTVSPDDFEGDSPLRGMEFQRKYEKLAYDLSGSHKAPIQLVGDFMEDRISTELGSVKPSYTGGYIFEDLRKCLPSYVVEALKEAIVDFDKKIKGYGNKDAVLTGIETRTSAPIRMLRDETLQSTSIKGIYPTGEGAGFAGGIISAAVDGMKAAEKIIERYKPLNK